MTRSYQKKRLFLKALVALCTILTVLLLNTENTLAQQNTVVTPLKKTDTTKAAQFFVEKNTVPKTPIADSVLAKAANLLKSTVILPVTKPVITKNAFAAPPGKNAIKTPGSKAAETKDVMGQKMKLLKKKAVSFDLVIESDNRYQPLPIINSINPAFAAFNSNKKFISAVNIIGGVNAWGIPLSFNYSTNRNLAYTPSALTSSLFKFDFDPGQFNRLLNNDFTNYYDLRKKVFSGLDLSGYSSKTISEKLNSNNLSPTGATGIAKYLKNPANMEGLYSLDDAGLKDSLYRIALKDSALRAYQAQASSAGNYSQDGVLNRRDLQAIADDRKLTAFLTDTMNKRALQTMNQEQLIGEFSKHSGIPDNNAGNQELFARLAKEFDASKGRNDSTTVFTMLRKEKAVSEKRQELLTQADSAYSTIRGIKNQLSGNGYDVKKIFQMQRILNPGNGNVGNSEIGRNYLDKTPINGLQQFFEHVEAFKVGAYGNNVPGNVQSRDIFATGTHLTFKSGGIPITVGFGNVNDVGSVKDNNFNNSVYNAPKGFTYLSAVLNRSSVNSVKVSVIGSYNQQSPNGSQYELPSVSDNNVVFTLSKAFTFKQVGQFNVDVSKSANVSSANYLNGTDAILEHKSGVRYDLANDMFQAFSFGLSHRLDIRELGFSDNVYFNYAGMGYQNPANTGIGGARMNVGGNLRKSLYKNKLQLTFRTDLKNRPISYTSNDKWNSLQFQLDSRYIINRKFNIDLKYISNNTNKVVNSVATPVYSLQKIQFDGNANYKIGKRYAVNHLTVAFQDYSNAYGITAPATGKGSILSTNFTQSVLFKRSSLNLSLFYNKELSTQKLIGNMFNSDLSYQYTLFSKLNLSSALTYLDNSNIARQVGVKQGIQLFTKNNFDADAYVDVRKNLIAVQYADLYASCRAELMLRYHIK